MLQTLFFAKCLLTEPAFYPAEAPSAFTLPQQAAGFLPFDEFARQFSLGSTSTEKVHAKTKNLSQTLQEDVEKGLSLLFDADQAVVDGYKRFIPVIESIAPSLARRMQEGGRVFLVGSGSSGRVAIDLAAKCNPAGKEQIRGVIAGGDSALIRAKEGFEDSEADGEKCLQPFDLQPEDTVILISASGSASFNVGCGHFAANKGANVLYFYNSEEIPIRTKQLFTRTNNPVHPLMLDIGPQAISGSTRLQGASLAELCCGSLLATACLHQESRLSEANRYPADLLEKMKEGNRLIGQQLGTLAQFVKREASVFLSPEANFRRLQDVAPQGYVTLIGEKQSLREILIDATETSPTFSVNPIRREGESLQKREEFRAYLSGADDNRAAWNALLGRETTDRSDTDQFVLGIQAPGANSYANRPTGPGNLVIGVAKEDPTEVLNNLSEARSQGADTALIFLTHGKVDPSIPLPSLTLALEEIPSDSFGFVETVLLKQVLNLISNGSMVLLNKVYGNQMIDVRASNQKLIDRSMRLIQQIWSDFRRPMPLSDRELYHLVTHLSALKKSFADRGVYTPSIVKIALAMLYLEKQPNPEQFQEAVDFLAERQELLDFLTTYTFCIDGGGSKTLLQVIDEQGRIRPLTKKGNTGQVLESGPSNINVVKKEGVKASLQSLFEEFAIDQRDFREVLSSSKVIAGMAGVGIPENLATVTSLFEELGIRKENLELLTDAELALKLLNGQGAVLISGTGSICFAEKNGVRQRVGGLGRILGDEGSGYQIGLQAVKAALAEEFGYGPPTQLTPALRIFFGVAEIKSLFPQINSLEMSAATIASASPLVFELAERDPIAQEILSRAAQELRQLVSTALKISQLSDCELHLWGGVFKGHHTEPLLAAIKEETEPRRITLVNQSSENAAVLLSRQRLR